jgi:hypothetical protein
MKCPKCKFGIQTQLWQAYGDFLSVNEEVATGLQDKSLVIRYKVNRDSVKARINAENDLTLVYVGYGRFHKQRRKYRRISTGKEA